MEDPAFMQVKYKYFPAEIRQLHNIDTLVCVDGYIYIKIKEGMYRLKQAAVLAYNHLVKHCSLFGYHPCP
jgi:hypothetical protein